MSQGVVSAWQLISEVRKNLHVSRLSNHLLFRTKCQSTHYQWPYDPELSKLRVLGEPDLLLSCFRANTIATTTAGWQNLIKLRKNLLILSCVPVFPWIWELHEIFLELYGDYVGIVPACYCCYGLETRGPRMLHARLRFCSITLNP